MGRRDEWTGEEGKTVHRGGMWVRDRGRGRRKRREGGGRGEKGERERGGVAECLWRGEEEIRKMRKWLMYLLKAWTAPHKGQGTSIEDEGRWGVGGGRGKK